MLTRQLLPDLRLARAESPAVAFAGPATGRQDYPVADPGKGTAVRELTAPGSLGLFVHLCRGSPYSILASLTGLFPHRTQRRVR